jgi:glutamate synthase (NADPH/NADH) small chain
VTIKNIEQSIVDKGFDEGWITPRNVSRRSGKEVAVVGSGPAGLAAADELNQMGHSVVVYERSDRIGGLLMYGIPNMKLGKDIVNRRINLLRSEGVEFIVNTDIGQDLMVAELRNKFDAIVFTTGATKARDLAAENRDAKGIYPAMEYLKENYKSLLDHGHVNKNQFSATDKDVVVIGGGDTGTDCIGTALRQGAKSIVNFELMLKPPLDRADKNPWPEWPIIYRVDYGHEEAASVYGKDPRRYQLLTKSFIKDKEGDVSGIKTVNVEFENGQLNEIPDTEKIWDAQLVLLSMGFVSPEHYLSDDAEIELDEKGNYKAEHGNFSTSKQGIFSAGDCRRGQSLVVWAINEGRGVARSVDSYLETL